ncbi:hypothetical protein Tbd_0763 [Thiobacillus denitrificans ATCC 25259]|uniref:MSHA biogenesis protein MshK n=1 Tax=Thiobacillus denitrificans (strain ATCC 25259 / T1) TaxID=292415 RepID=Q3SKQ9_THIDA|nr:hypothetical protein [Thiobacillus denitrificans]AAZ96716.1 hypothetical protein Tbd_0763 [Thiobacillus denitrificans ATCC 25259]
MAARMMRPVLAALLAAPLAALALPDPTALPVAPGAGGAEAGAGATLAAIKRNGHTRIAVIGGREFAEGGHYQDARIVRIGESEVVLRRGGETTVLRLYPQVEKRPRGK